MRNVGLKSGYAVLSAFALVLSVGRPLLAALPTANFYLNGVSGLSYAGVYTSPYEAQINPDSTNIGGATVNAICDDFSDNSYLPEDWNAYVTTLSDIAAGTYNNVQGYDPNLRWKEASSDGLNNQLQAYDAAAILSIEILQNNTPLVQEELSFALWDLFDPTTGIGGTNHASGPAPGEDVSNWPGINTTPGFLTAAQGYVTNAVNQVTTDGAALSNLSNYKVTIYSYENDATCYSPGPSCPSAPPQEFITVTAVPEASSLAMFAAYLLFGGGSLLFFGRRRMLRNR